MIGNVGEIQKRISWGAILAGVSFVLVVQLLLSMLGMGIGLSVVGEGSAKAIGWGAAAWWFLSALTAFYIGGWVSGRLAGIPRVADSVLHGILSWNVATLLTLLLFTTAMGKIMGGAFGVLGGTTGQEIAAMSGGAGEGIDSIVERARDGLEQRQVPAGEGAVLIGFFALLLGAVSAALGGRAATARTVRSERARREEAHNGAQIRPRV